MLEFFAVFTTFLVISMILVLANQRMLQLGVTQSFKQASDPTIEKKRVPERLINFGSTYFNFDFCGVYL